MFFNNRSSTDSSKDANEDAVFNHDYIDGELHRCEHYNFLKAPISSGDHDYNPYEIVKDIKLTYPQSSYMMYHQLFRKNIRKISYGDEYPWFENGVEQSSLSWNTDAKYRWFCGISKELPSNRLKMYEVAHSSYTEVFSGFIDYEFGVNTYNEIVYKATPESTVVDNAYFWLLVPHFESESPNVKLYCDVEPKNGNLFRASNIYGVEWDLASSTQPCNEDNITYFSIGANADYVDAEYLQKVNYRLFYVKLRENDGQIGIHHIDQIKVLVRTLYDYLIYDGYDESITPYMSDDTADRRIVRENR